MSEESMQYMPGICFVDVHQSVPPPRLHSPLIWYFQEDVPRVRRLDHSEVTVDCVIVLTLFRNQAEGLEGLDCAQNKEWACLKKVG